MAAPIRVGVVGHGYFGRFHAKHFETHPAAQLVGIADPSSAAADQVKAAYGDRYFTDYSQLIGLVDAVAIATPTASHEAIGEALLKAGVHILVEKPLCESALAAAALAALAEERRLVLNVGHIERFSATFRQLKRELSEPPTLLECQRHAPWQGRIIDVDVILDMMIHDIDLALDLMASEPVHVEASGLTMMGHGLDFVMARIGFANRSTAHISASRVAPATSRIVQAAELGRTVRADLANGRIGVFTADGVSLRDEAVPWEDGLRAEIDTFLAAVGGQTAGGVSGREAVAALDLADRIREAVGREKHWLIASS